MNALILINKPVGIRSTQCVAVVRKSLGGLKVGHAGTLDSTASGLLVLLAGQASRLCEYVMSLPKVYRTVIQFGIETDTYDYSGEVLAEHSTEFLTVKAIDDALYKFSGVRLQSPPAISAVKIDGVPAHKLARSGQDVKTRERPVFFRRIDVVTPYNPEDGTLELDVLCGKGTYIRSLARDLGRISGCGAYVKSLTRTAIGNFSLTQAESPETTEDFRPVSLSELAKNFTRIYVGKKDAKSFTNGMSILLGHALEIHRGISLMNGSLCVEGDEFLGFGTYAGYDYLRPVAVVPK